MTLTGPGGIGKSSLAVEVARAVAPRFPDGAWFVPLADIADPADVAGAIAHGIGLLDGPERSAEAALVPYLAERSLVLVLDNLEHLLAGAETIAALVRASPTSRVLVTSRAPLHVAGEHEIPVPPLSDDAIRLFTERARATRPDWDPAADADTVAEICRLLDDLPLGIELAAARVAAAAARGHPRSPAGAPAPARVRATRRPRPPAHARRGRGLEPRPADPRTTGAAARPRGVRRQLRLRAGRGRGRAADEWRRPAR